MALTSTNALITIQDNAGAVQAPAAGGTVQVEQGTTLNVALASTSGVARWELTFNCPQYPGLHGRSYTWLQGMANMIQVPLADFAISAASSQSGVMLSSVVTDSVQSIANATFFLTTLGENAVPMQHYVRAVINSALATYANTNGVITASANGAIGSVADGVTLAVGDLVLLPNGIAATGVDAGVYQVTALGATGAKFVLTASSDWGIGSTVLKGTECRVAEGTVYKGTTWVVTNTGLTNLVGTASFTFYPRQVTQSITLVAGTATVTNVPIISATQVGVYFMRTTANTSTATTGGYNPVGAITPGALGTASMVFDATVAAGTINVSDISTGGLTIVNPC